MTPSVVPAPGAFRATSGIDDLVGRLPTGENDGADRSEQGQHVGLDVEQAFGEAEPQPIPSAPRAERGAPDHPPGDQP